jgi:hypothetical protein
MRGRYTRPFLGLKLGLILGLGAMGCAANVDEPVDQLPEPTEQRAPPPTPFGAEVRFIDPLMQALIDEARNGVGEIPGREKPYYDPLENCPTCQTR